MKSRRVIKRRKQSKPARHTEASPYACVGQLYLSIEPNPVREFSDTEIVTERCMGCGRVLMVWGVMQELEPVNNDDEDDGA